MSDVINTPSYTYHSEWWQSVNKKLYLHCLTMSAFSLSDISCVNVQRTTAVAANVPNSFTLVCTLNSHVDSIFADTDSLRC